MCDFASRLIRWQRRYGRHDLPWQDAGVYHIWLSEIMLQQTQVSTVIPYYQRFVASFPTIAALAAATEDQVLAHWSGLGYYARGRNLHRAARIIMERYHGRFPQQFKQILELPGIGRSTAAAICALSFHERRTILDGNVKRVLARYCGIEGWPGNRQVEAQLWQQAETLLPNTSRGGKAGIAVYTQALMDMGATVCTTSKPQCAICPVQARCSALQTGRVAELPAPRPRRAVPEKYAIFLMLTHGNDILLEKRYGSGIWGGLWCLPQFDDETAAMAWCIQHGAAACLPPFGVSRSTRRPGRVGKQQEHPLASSKSQTASEHERVTAAIHEEQLQPFIHVFTHLKLHITPVLLRLAHKPHCVGQSGSAWLDVKVALQAAIPAPVRNLLQELDHSVNGA